MKRLLTMVLLGFLALGIAGLSAGSAGAGPANCAPQGVTVPDDVKTALDLVAYAERAKPSRNANLAEGEQFACNSACARGCASRFGRCPTRECRQQFSACVRGCGC